MGKTFDQSLIDTANIPMSMIDPEDMADTTSEEFISLRRVQQGAHNELTNREDFPFNKYTKTIMTMPNMATYTVTEGTVEKVYIKGDRELKYDSEIPTYDNINNAEPTKYCVKYNPDKIQLYPVPDKKYNINIVFNNTKNVIDVNDEPSYEITIGSTLRMPERVQHLYFDALEYYVLTENMRKQSNPRWQPTQQIFEAKWRVFLKACRGTDSDTYFAI